jgi:hypothetical protein
MLSVIERVCNHDSDGLAIEAYFVLKDVKPLADFRVDKIPVGPIGEPRCVTVRDDGQHAREPHDQRGVDANHSAGANRAANDDRMGKMRLIELGRVSRAASYFGVSVNTLEPASY